MVGFGTVCNNWHAFEKRYANNLKYRALHFVDIPAGKEGTRGHKNPSVQGQEQSYMRGLVEACGYVAAGVDAQTPEHERLQLFYLPRWMPRFVALRNQDPLKTYVALRRGSQYVNFLEEDVDECNVQELLNDALARTNVDEEK